MTAERLRALTRREWAELLACSAADENRQRRTDGDLRAWVELRDLGLVQSLRRSNVYLTDLGRRVVAARAGKDGGHA